MGVAYFCSLFLITFTNYEVEKLYFIRKLAISTLLMHPYFNYQSNSVHVLWFMIVRNHSTGMLDGEHNM